MHYSHFYQFVLSILGSRLLVSFTDANDIDNQKSFICH